MSRYDDYIARYCRTGSCTPEAARKLAICREVEKYYNSEEEETETPLRHEFVCCSES